MAETLFEECYVMKLLPPYKWQLFHNRVSNLLDEPKYKKDKDIQEMQTLVDISEELITHPNDAQLNSDFWDALDDFHTYIQKSESPIAKDPRMDAWLHNFVNYCKVGVNKNRKA